MAFQSVIKGEGKTIQWLNGTGAAVNVGSVQQCGDLFGVVCGTLTEDATTTVANGAVGELQVTGLIQLPKLSTDVFAQGQTAFWDATNSRLTITPIGNGRIGCAVIEPGLTAMPISGDLTQHILLNDVGQATGEDVVVTTSASTTLTLTAAQLLGKFLISTNAGAAAWTTPTGTQISAALPGVKVGFSFVVTIRVTGSNTVTLTGGTGVTLAAGNTNTIVTLHTRSFRFVNSGANTWDCYALQDSAH